MEMYATFGNGHTMSEILVKVVTDLLVQCVRTRTILYRSRQCIHVCDLFCVTITPFQKGVTILGIPQVLSFDILCVNSPM